MGVDSGAKADPRREPSRGRPLLATKGIDKSFPGVHALRGVDLEVYEGEVHVLCGENGAGKSTLVHVLAGVCQPDKGSIFFDGSENLRFRNEHEAQLRGIGIVYQERTLVNLLSIAENVYAGRQPVRGWGWIDEGALLKRTAELLEALDLPLDPRTPAGSLSPAQQQIVEIARALSLSAKLLIFDEPTSSLTHTEVASLFRVIRELQRRGVGIIYISHRLDEIFGVGDRVSVLRDGQYLGTFALNEVTPEGLIAAMVGRQIAERPARHPSARREQAPPVLEIRHLADGERLRDVSLSVRAGEILAIAGLAGSGRTELALALFGAARRTSGEILLDGTAVYFHSPGEAVAAGIAYVPEERREAGLFLGLTAVENIAAPRLWRFGRWWVDDDKACSVAEHFGRALNVHGIGAHAPVETLSGGNQQKVMLARWLSLNPKVLIVDEPTRGIDVGAKAEVHDLLCRLAEGGTAVILISSEFPEILAIADRIAILRQGRLSGTIDAYGATEEAILRYATTTAAS